MFEDMQKMHNKMMGSMMPKGKMGMMSEVKKSTKKKMASAIKARHGGKGESEGGEM